MKLARLRIEGFGSLCDLSLEFAPHFNVVYGPNEAGKSTLMASVLALLYGCARGDKEFRRPWSGARYAAALSYELADGRWFEVQRDFERDSRGVRVYDAYGNDASAEASVGKNVAPGLAHLGLPLEVFVNAAFVAQGEATVDASRPERIAHALARALDGGPKEDAALGALQRLDEALALHVGKPKATVNAPLRRLQAQLAAAESEARQMRARLDGLGELRRRAEAQNERSRELSAALHEHERRGRALRAETLRSRLAALRRLRDDLAALQAERAGYADVEGFQAARVTELEELYRAWLTEDALADERAAEAARATPAPALLAELRRLEAAGVSPDEPAFAKLESAAQEARLARAAAEAATQRARAAEHRPGGGGELAGAALASGVVFAVLATALCALRDWLPAGAAAALGILCFGLAAQRFSRRRQELRRAQALQRAAFAASALDGHAAAALAALLRPLGAAALDEVVRRRTRVAELRDRATAAAALERSSARSFFRASEAAAAFDQLAALLLEGSLRPVRSGPGRVSALNAVKMRHERQRAREGLEARLSMLAVQRTDLLGLDDEFALEAEMSELTASGTVPVPAGGKSARAFEVERADLQRRAGESRALSAALAAELRSAEAQIGDLASLDERGLQLRAETERLERFEAALLLARRTIDDRTREAHGEFARRLADYASTTFAQVTGDRYLDLRVDPSTLAVRVRVPETGAMVELERLSAGTREQAYLVVRLAMARMFSEGLERAPLLLDDPFVYWDEARLARGLPILEATSQETQIVLFTASEELARAVAARGGRTLDLRAEKPALAQK